MVEENLKDKIEKMKILKAEEAQRGAVAAEESEKIAVREREILASIRNLEDSLPTICGTVTDSEAFLTENRRYLKLEWVLFKSSAGKIKILYTETPTEAAKGTKYTSKREEQNVEDWGIFITRLELINKRLPAFVDILYQEAQKHKR